MRAHTASQVARRVRAGEPFKAPRFGLCGEPVNGGGPTLVTNADAFHALTDLVVRGLASYYVADTRSGLVVLARLRRGVHEDGSRSDMSDRTTATPVVLDELDLLRPDLRAATRMVVREAFLTSGLS